MDINDEIQNIELEIKRLESEMKEMQAAGQQKIDAAKTKREEIIEKIQKEGFGKCDWCKKMSLNSDFHTIIKREVNVECVYRDIINSGGNRYAIVEKKNTYLKCPKCNSLKLFDSLQISESSSYDRDHEFSDFTPISEIITSTEDAKTRKRNELIEEMCTQQEIANTAKKNIKKIKNEMERTC